MSATSPLATDLWHRDTLLDLDMDSIRSNGYSLQVEMNYRTLTRGHKILEVPIHFTDRDRALMPIRLREHVS